MEKTHHVSEYKKKIVADIVKYIAEYPIIGIVNMENLPASQLQAMKTKLRGKVHLFMTKKRLMKNAFDQVKTNNKGIEDLEKHFQGMPALLFTNDSPFKLSRTLQQSKSAAPAKAGQISPKDIVIPKGPTSFAPGPIISELSSIGIKTGVEQGKVAVKEDSLVVKKGEKIKQKAAEVLTRLGIKPMEVGLDLVAAYENGTIYSKDILLIDEKEFMNKLNNACSGAFNLAIFIGYLAKGTIKTLLSKAFNDAKALGLSQNIIDKGIIDELLAKAERSMLGLKSTANIEVKEKPKEMKEKKQAEEKKEKVKEEVKEETKVEEPKKEEPVEIKKEEILEKEKKILEEEKEIEKKAKEKEKEESDFEKESEEAVKEEEEKQLETERIEEEKKLEESEKREAEVKEKAKQVEETKEEPTIEEKPKKKQKEDVDSKVSKMVEETKKFVAGEKGSTADDLIKEVNEESKKEEAEKQEAEVEEKKKKGSPSAHDLAKKKKHQEQKEVENLAKELIKKGTLRK